MPWDREAFTLHWQYLVWPRFSRRTSLHTPLRKVGDSISKRRPLPTCTARSAPSRSPLRNWSNLYFKRIEAYNGTCVKGDVDPATGLMLGDLTPIENAGQINAYMTLNIRGKRSKTDKADNDPKMSDALEIARDPGRILRAHWTIGRSAARHSVRGKGQLRHRRHAHDRWRRRRLCQRQAAEGRDHGGEAARFGRDHPRQDQFG